MHQKHRAQSRVGTGQCSRVWRRVKRAAGARAGSVTNARAIGCRAAHVGAARAHSHPLLADAEPAWGDGESASGSLLTHHLALAHLVKRVQRAPVRRPVASGDQCAQ